MKHLINLLLLVVPFVAVTAQKTLDKGYVRLEITDISSDDPETAMLFEMIKGSEIEVYFTENKYLTTMNMFGGMMNLSSIVNTETEQMDMLCEVLGSKMWVDTDLAEANKNKPRDMSGYDVAYDRSQTKEILGYKAFKVTISMPDEPGMKVEGWLTDEIKTKANIIQGMEDLKLQGFPLEFTVVKSQMKLTFGCTDIKDTVDESVFVLNTEGYQKMTMEEFNKQVGGMSGMGF